MRRDEALKELHKKPYNQEKINLEIDYVSKKLGIEKNEFLEIFNAPKKSYKNYPNDEKKIRVYIWYLQEIFFLKQYKNICYLIH